MVIVSLVCNRGIFTPHLGYESWVVDSASGCWVNTVYIPGLPVR